MAEFCRNIWCETFHLSRNDIHTLLFYGQSVPLTRTEELRHPDGAVIVTIVIDGHITGPVRKRENIYTFDRETYCR